MTTTLPLDSILVEDRMRKDHGELDTLADSIRDYGLIQPVVINQQNRLIAGGRRLAACKQLGWTEIPVVYKETLDEHHLTILELEENIRRKEMSWKEEVAGIAKLHSLKAHETALEGLPWSAKRTGEMLGMKRANVDFALAVARELEDPKSTCHNCISMWDAMKVLARRREDLGQAELSAMIKSQFVAPPPVPGQERLLEAAPQVEGVIEPVSTHERVVVPLSTTIILGDSIKWMRSQPDGAFDHIITDPPYAIDVKMMAQGGEAGMVDIDRVAHTHDVEENLELLSYAIPEMVRLLKPKGFLVLWCDPTHWDWIRDDLCGQGLAVQRWPFVWHKISPCKNEAAQYNFTKNIEFAVIARQVGAVLKKPITSSVFSCANTPYISNPYAKPYEVWVHLIEAVSFIGETILDPFMGEGSSTYAVASTHRKPVGVELDEKHYNVALDRIRSLYDVMLRKPIYT